MIRRATARRATVALCSLRRAWTRGLGGMIWPRIVAWWQRWFPPRTLGQRGEDAAARYLRRHGFRILARGRRHRLGELDLVAVERRSRTVVFVEVKTRQWDDPDDAAAAVDQHKQVRLTRLAVAFLKRHGLLQHAARFDVVAVCWPPGQRRPRVVHIPNAFEAAARDSFYG
jgi:putative endonuclease